MPFMTAKSRVMWIGNPMVQNQVLNKPKATYADVFHSRLRSAAATDKMDALQRSSSWPPTSYPENVVQSHCVLLCRRKAALFGHYLLTHIPPLRDEAGHNLIYNRHLKICENNKGEGVYQHRRIGDRPSKNIPLPRREGAVFPGWGCIVLWKAAETSVGRNRHRSSRTD